MEEIKKKALAINGEIADIVEAHTPVFKYENETNMGSENTLPSNGEVVQQ